MKFKIKKYAYLLNDITNIILKKERDEEMKKIIKLESHVRILFLMLMVSILLNIYFIFQLIWS